MRNRLGQFISEGKCKKINGDWYRSRCADCNKWLKGTYSQRCKSCFSVFCIGENSQNWKGDKVGYAGLHRRIKKVFKKPNKCMKCGLETDKLHLANKSQKYLHTIDDWFYLCIKCHFNYDEISRRGWITRKRNMQNAG